MKTKKSKIIVHGRAAIKNGRRGVLGAIYDDQTAMFMFFRPKVNRDVNAEGIVLPAVHTIIKGHEYRTILCLKYDTAQLLMQLIHGLVVRLEAQKTVRPVTAEEARKERP